eukprot:1161106-Pelagomonas_calceolata.AAC.5
MSPLRVIENFLRHKGTFGCSRAVIGLHWPDSKRILMFFDCDMLLLGQASLLHSLKDFKGKFSQHLAAADWMPLELIAKERQNNINKMRTQCDLRHL